MNKIRVFSAGVAGSLAKIAAQRFEAENQGATCEVVLGGSTDGIRRLRAGENFDVMILADSSNIDQMMMPEYADSYFVWGGNEMVIMGDGLNAANWKEKLLDPSVSIRHMNPYGDPSGYRAVMAMKLADKVEPGLSEKLLNHPGYHGLDKEQYTGPFKMLQPEEGVYSIVYKSMAFSKRAEFAPLPPQMNLGVPACEEIYKTAEFAVSDSETVRGTTILHAITIPLNAANKAGGEAYAKLFLANRFPIFGFTPVERKVGNWNIKPANMWDNEARYYSLMTLMEVNGTNKQLDAVPLDAEDVVLDCGCGPGRVAIQAAKRVRKVICLDSSEGMLEECKKNCAAAGVTNVEFVLADWQITEVGKTIPEVDVVIQARGGGGPSSLAMLRKAARKYAVNMIWSDGAPCLPESRNKLFVGCYSEEAQEQHPDLRPFHRPKGLRPGEKNDGKLFGGKNPVPMEDKLPFDTAILRQKLNELGVEAHTTTVEEGWDRQFKTKQEAYDWLIQLSKYPELVNMDVFRANVDTYLTENEEGWYFFLPTSTDITWFKTRP